MRELQGGDMGSTAAVPRGAGGQEAGLLFPRELPGQEVERRTGPCVGGSRTWPS